jgi:hypothetical protein
VARGKNRAETGRGKLSTRQPKRRLGTSEARETLPRLVQELASFSRPAGSLADRAVELGPRMRGGAWLVPEVDAQAAIERELALAERVVALEELVEDLTAAPVVAARATTPLEQWETLDEFAERFGLSAVLREARAAGVT